MYTYLTGSHHHTAADGVKRVRGDTSTSGDGPAEQEGGEEVALERADQDDRLDGVVHTEVQTTVDDNSKNGGTETTVETGNTIGSKGLLVDVHETVKLTLTTSLLHGLGIVGKTGTGVVEGVDEEERSGTSSLERVSIERFAVKNILTPPEARLPAIHLPYPSRSFLKANMDL